MVLIAYDSTESLYVSQIISSGDNDHQKLY